MEEAIEGKLDADKIYRAIGPTGTGLHFGFTILLHFKGTFVLACA